MRFGVIGSNFIVDTFLSAAKLCDNFVLQAVYSRTLTRAQEYACEWGAVSAYDDLAMLASDSQVEAVYIASPNSLHYEQAARMLNAGKHVLVEKPAALCQKDWEELLRLAREKHLLVLEAMRPDFLPGLTTIREMMATIAPIRSAFFSYNQYSSRYDRFKAGIVENAFDPTLGNGALMDIGVYCVHWMVAMFGRPTAVSGCAVFLPMSIDAVGSAVGQYPDRIAQCIYSKVHASNTPSRIEGEGGTVELSPFPLPNKLRVSLRATGEVREVELGHIEQDMAYEVNAFTALCAHPAEAEIYQHQTSDTLWVLDGVREQAGIDFVPKPAHV